MRPRVWIVSAVLLLAALGFAAVLRSAWSGDEAGPTAAPDAAQTESVGAADDPPSAALAEPSPASRPPMGEAESPAGPLRAETPAAAAAMIAPVSPTPEERHRQLEAQLEREVEALDRVAAQQLEEELGHFKKQAKRSKPPDPKKLEKQREKMEKRRLRREERALAKQVEILGELERLEQ